MTQHIDPREIIQLRVLADVLELRHVNGVPCAVLPIPMTLGDTTQRYIATGTKAEIAQLLEIDGAQAEPAPAGAIRPAPHEESPRRERRRFPEAGTE